MATILLSHKANVHIYRDTPLTTAIDNQNVKMVSLLLKFGADINVSFGYAIQKAVDFDNLELIKLLLDHGAKVDDIRRWNDVDGETMELLKKYDKNL